MMKQEDLLDKYYKGETTLEEEKLLKEYFAAMNGDSAEKEMFGYFQDECNVPSDLEASVSSGLNEKLRKRKITRIRFFSISSVAAAILIILSIYLNIQTERNAKVENDFLVMEKALFQVSESIQPEEQQEMLVLWVDDDVEIIIN